jgi:hypothetical protein
VVENDKSDRYGPKSLDIWAKLPVTDGSASFITGGAKADVIL